MNILRIVGVVIVIGIVVWVVKNPDQAATTVGNGLTAMGDAVATLGHAAVVGITDFFQRLFSHVSA